MDTTDPPTKRRASRRSTDATTTTTTKKRKAESSAAPAAKRARNGKQGRLASLLSISLDIVFEILGHLQPFDLLRVARISKEFRAMLMSKSSITIWRASLANVPNFPPCAPGMNEPQWVALAFDATCHSCFGVARKVDWGLFIRLCGRCAKKQLLTRLNLRNGGIDILDLLPTRPDTLKPYLNVYYIKEYDRIKTLFMAKNMEEKEKFAQERKDYVKALAEHTKLCEEWSEGVSDARSAELADLKEERYKAIIVKLTALGWGAELDSMLPSDSLRSHKVARVPTALTQRTWKTIEPELVQYMEQMKRKRLAREHASLVVTRKNMAKKFLCTFKQAALPWTDVMPGAPDFCEFPAVKAVIVQSSAVEVTEKTFEAMLPDLPEMITTWREGLAPKLRKDCRSLEPIEEAKLELATTVFKCTSCSLNSSFHQYDSDDEEVLSSTCRPLYWPRVLAHRCLTRVSDFPLFLSLMGGLRDVEWSPRSLMLDRDVSEVVKKVVVACGMDPETTTVEELDEADHRLACHRCAVRESDASTVKDGDNAGVSGFGSGSAPGSASASTSTQPVASTSFAKATETAEPAPATVKVYTWRNAVLHHRGMHSYLPTAWHKLDDEEAAAARAMERETMANGTKEAVVKQILVKHASSLPRFKRKGAATDTANDAASDAANEDKPDAEKTVDNEAVPDAGSGVASAENANIEEDEAAETEAKASDAEESSIVPAQWPQLAWCCAHCIEGIQENPPMTLENIIQHLMVRHEMHPSDIRVDEDYFKTLAAPEVYNPDWFPVPKLRVVMPPAPPMAAAPSSIFSLLGRNPLSMYDDWYYSDSDEEMMERYGYGYDSDDEMYEFW